MIEKMAANLVELMEKEKMIDRTDCEYYKYALITLAERFITIGTLLLIGLFFDQFVMTICFLVFFFSLRKRTGGYHAEKFWQCYLVTIVTYIAVIQAVLWFSEKPVVMYIMLAFAVLIIEIIGTVNHPNMDMDRNELKEAKKAARLRTLMETMVIIVLIALEVDGLYVHYMSFAIILCASLLCVAKIMKQEVKIK